MNQVDYQGCCSGDVVFPVKVGVDSLGNVWITPSMTLVITCSCLPNSTVIIDSMRN